MTCHPQYRLDLVVKEWYDAARVVVIKNDWAFDLGDVKRLNERDWDRAVKILVSMGNRERLRDAFRLV